MSNETKACNLTKTEIENLINYHGYSQGNDFDSRLDRMNYLHKRLKSFDEAPKIEVAQQPEPAKKDGW